MPRARITFADLIDYEWQLARDRNRDEKGLLERDSRLLLGRNPELQPLPASRAGLVHSWLEALRLEDRGRWPGQVWAQGHLTMVFLLCAIGLAAGAGTAQVFLRYDGSTPINVIPFLAFFVALQLLLLLIGTLKKWLVPSHLPIILQPLARMAEARLRRMFQKKDQAREIEATWRRMNTLHGKLHVSIVVQLILWFSTAFHLGAFLTTLITGTFSDLAFSWGTTLNIDDQTVAGIVKAIALPFAWAGADLVPDPAAVAASRFVRLDGNFLPTGTSRALQSLVSNTWWKYLVACLFCYALAPRIVLLTLSLMVSKRLTKRVCFHDQASEAVLQRLYRAKEGSLWQTDPECPSIAAKGQPPLDDITPQDASLHRSQKTVALLWRDVPVTPHELARTLSQHGFSPPSDTLAGSGTEAEFDAVLVRLKLHYAHGTAAQDLALLVVSETWELPGQAIARLITRIRQSVAFDLKISFLPWTSGAAQPSVLTGTDRKVWLRAVAELHDPYVGLWEISR